MVIFNSYVSLPEGKGILFFSAPQKMVDWDFDGFWGLWHWVNTMVYHLFSWGFINIGIWIFRRGLMGVWDGELERQA